MTEFEIKEKPIHHPMEDVLDIEPGTTMTEYVEAVPMEVVKPQTYDEKDGEIEDQLQEVFEAAMEQFEITREEAQVIEGKYKARNGEVAIQALNTALQAVRTKAEVKSAKDKLHAKQSGSIEGPRTLNQNLIVADRNEILDILGKEDD